MAAGTPPSRREIRDLLAQALAAMEEEDQGTEEIDISPIKAAWTITWSTEK